MLVRSTALTYAHDRQQSAKLTLQTTSCVPHSGRHGTRRVRSYRFQHEQSLDGITVAGGFVGKTSISLGLRTMSTMRDRQDEAHYFSKEPHLI
jgi:hypothetical protein